MSMMPGGFSPSDIEEMKQKVKKAEERTRSRFNLVYGTINGLNKEQLEGLMMMLTLAVNQEEPDTIVQQLHYYQGFVMGALARYTEDGDYTVYPDDVMGFPEDDDSPLEGLLPAAGEGHTGQYV
jgi:hypothetical protein